MELDLKLGLELDSVLSLDYIGATTLICRAVTQIVVTTYFSFSFSFLFLFYFFSFSSFISIPSLP